MIIQWQQTTNILIATAALVVVVVVAEAAEAAVTAPATPCAVDWYQVEKGFPIAKPSSI